MIFPTLGFILKIVRSKTFHTLVDRTVFPSNASTFPEECIAYEEEALFHALIVEGLETSQFGSSIPFDERVVSKVYLTILSAQFAAI